MAEQNLPVPLDHAGARRVYLGGRNIRQLHGCPAPEDDYFPEEWIASVTEAAGADAAPGAGLSRLRDNASRTLRDLIASDPVSFLGEPFVQQHGESPGVLLKLLDAAERLNVQVHPSREEATQFWGLPFGKTECWYFLEGRQINGQPPCIYLGLRPEVQTEDLRQAFEQGDSQQVLACMHRFPVKAGETVLVGSGIPHAIGAGCFLMEIQEPSDITLRLERFTSSGVQIPDEICHMGAGYDAMFSMIHYPGLSREETWRKCFIPPVPLAEESGGRVTKLLDYSRCPYFSMDLIKVWKVLRFPEDDIFSGLFVLHGKGELLAGGQRFPLRAGDQFFIPAGCPAISLYAEEAIRLIRFFGPQVNR